MTDVRAVTVFLPLSLSANAGSNHVERSAHSKPGGAKRRNVRFEPGLVTPKLGFQPRCDGEVRRADISRLAASFGFSA